MEVPGLNSGFLDTPLYPVVTALLGYLDPTILHLFGFCFITCTSVPLIIGSVLNNQS